MTTIYRIIFSILGILSLSLALSVDSPSMTAGSILLGVWVAILAYLIIK